VGQQELTIDQLKAVPSAARETPFIAVRSIAVSSIEVSSIAISSTTALFIDAEPIDAEPTDAEPINALLIKVLLTSQSPAVVYRNLDHPAGFGRPGTKVQPGLASGVLAAQIA
jgi:hypothetical protein